MRTTSQSPDGLLARQTNVALDTMGLADIAGNAHAVERSARLVGLYPKDAVFACHLVKGSALNLGLPRVARAAQALETLGINGTTAGSEPLLEELRAEVDTAVEALQRATSKR